MIITKTPLRISFVGGGTDLQSYYQYSSGSVVSTTIDRYIYVFVNKIPGHRIQVNYSKMELVNNVDEIEHNIVREALKMAKIKSGIGISYIGDMPFKDPGTGLNQGSGLGSSSALAVGILNAFYALQGQDNSPETLARDACRLEIEILQNPIGKQDQYAAAYGGLNFIQFRSDDTVLVEPINPREETKKMLKENLVLFYTGMPSLESHVVLSEQKQKTPDNLENLKKMADFSLRLRGILINNDIGEFGKLLHQNWILKQKLASKITNDRINSLYEKAISAGADGGKILGSGGGGFLLLHCPKNKKNEIRRALNDLEELEFNFGAQGSKIVYAD